MQRPLIAVSPENMREINVRQARNEIANAVKRWERRHGRAPTSGQRITLTLGGWGEINHETIHQIAEHCRNVLQFSDVKFRNDWARSGKQRIILIK